MKRSLLILMLLFVAGSAAAQHPDTSGPGWTDLFAPDLSDAIFPEGVWRVEDGLLTASEDEILWSGQSYDRFVLDLEFKNAPGTNSGVFVYGSDLDDWAASSIEIQIADDYAEQWAEAPAHWQCGAVFGHLPARTHAVKPPGAWNRYTITADGDSIRVVLNGALVNEIDLRRWTSATRNPDGSEIPEWLSRPLAELPRHGHIGFQGKHAGAPIWFRNIRIKKLEE